MKNTKLALLVCAFMLFSTGWKKKGKAAAPSDAVPVTVAKAVKKDMPVLLTSPGTVQTINSATIRSQVDGIIKQIYYKEGQMVSRGDMLILIDDAPFQEALRQALAALEKDTADMNFYRAEEARYRVLLASGAASQEDYDTQNTQYQKFIATVESDRAQVSNAKINLSYTKIMSPLNGKTGAKLADVGDTVKKNDTSLLTINQISPIYVQFSLAEKYLNAVKEKQKTGYLKVDAASQSQPDRFTSGKLTFIDNTVDSATGQIMMKASFENGDGNLWPGLFVNAVLTLSTQKNAVVVPAPAVMSSQNGQYIFVVNPDNTVSQKTVAVDRNIKDEMILSSGLNGGETIVTDGQIRLRDGSRIQIKNNPAPATATGKAN